MWLRNVSSSSLVQQIESCCNECILYGSSQWHVLIYKFVLTPSAFEAFISLSGLAAVPATTAPLADAKHMALIVKIMKRRMNPTLPTTILFREGNSMAAPPLSKGTDASLIGCCRVNLVCFYFVIVFEQT